MVLVLVLVARLLLQVGKAKNDPRRFPPRLPLFFYFFALPSCNCGFLDSFGAQSTAHS